MEETTSPPQSGTKVIWLTFGKTWWGTLLAAVLGVCIGVALGAGPQIREAIGLGRSSSDAEVHDAVLFSRQIAQRVQDSPPKTASDAMRVLDLVHQRRARYASEDARALLTQATRTASAASAASAAR